MLHPLFQLSYRIDEQLRSVSIIPDSYQSMIAQFCSTIRELQTAYFSESRIAYHYQDQDQDQDHNLPLSTILPWAENGDFVFFRDIITCVLDGLKSISPFISSFILYGSLANGTYTSKSDALDAILILRDELAYDNIEFEKVISHILALNKSIYSLGISNFEPFNFLFERDLISLPPHYRKGILEQGKILVGKLPSFIPVSDEYEFQCKRYGLINKFQKLRHEAANVIKQRPDSDEIHNFVTLFRKHIKNSFEGLVISSLEYEVDSLKFDIAKRNDIDKTTINTTSSNIDLRDFINKIMESYRQAVCTCYGIEK